MELEIAVTLLGEFFKPLPATARPSGDTTEEPSEEGLLIDPITEAEVHRAVFATHPRKAPGTDDIPAVV
jgi:hypothetical protein